MSAPRPARPLVTVSVFLFGKPAWEIDGLEGADIDAKVLDDVSACGRELLDRLERAAEIGRKMLDAGWEGCGLLYDIDFYKETSLEDAEQELEAMGIGCDEVSIREDASEEPDGENYYGDGE